MQVEFDLFINNQGQVFLTPIRNNTHQFQYAPPEWLAQTVPKRKPFNSTQPAHMKTLPWVSMTADAAPCVICMENIRKWGKQLPCGHAFHLKCIMKAFQHQTQCPMCRTQFETPKSLLKKQTACR